MKIYIIVEVPKKMGLSEPEFESLRGDFKVIFRKEKKTTQATPPKTEKYLYGILRVKQIKILNLIIEKSNW